MIGETRRNAAPLPAGYADLLEELMTIAAVTSSTARMSLANAALTSLSDRQERQTLLP